MEQEKEQSLTSSASQEASTGKEEAPKTDKAAKKKERGPQIAFDLSMAFAPFALCAVVVTLVGMCSGFLTSGMPGWLCEICASFRAQCIVALLIICIPSFISKPWRIMAIICAVLALINVLLVSPILDGNKLSPSPSSYLSFHLLEMRMDKESVSVEDVAKLAKNKASEILVIVDVDLAKMAKLNEALPTFRHRAAFPDSKGHGVLFFSEVVPFKGNHTLKLGPDKIPVAVTTAFLENGWSNVVAFKAPAATDGASFDKRNKFLEAVSKAILDLKGPTIICANLDMTPYAGSYGKFLGDAKLKSLRPGFTVKPNSHVGPQDLFLNRLPLDNLFVNNQVTFSERTVVPDYKGKNLPLYGTFAVSNKDEKWVAPKGAAPPKKVKKTKAKSKSKSKKRKRSKKRRRKK